MNLKLIINKRQTIIVISLVFLLVVTIFTSLQPVRYGAKSKIMVVQKFKRDVDPYALASSKSYISTVLAEVITTHSFYNKVARGELGVERGYFEKEADVSNVLRKWKKTVSVSTKGDLGLIEIMVKHPEVNQSENISNGILEVLSNEHAKFYNGENVKLKIVNPPVIGLTSPNIKLNLVIAFVMGLSAAFAYIVLFPEPEHDLNIFKKKKSGLLEIQTMGTLDK